MANKYEYQNLSKKSVEVLVNELNENQDQVNAHIESFRRWVTSMRHLKCPTDSNFLIKFLRVSKYDHKKAQRRLDNFCTSRVSPRGSPQLFKYFKIEDPIFEKIINLKTQIPLGKNDAGELVVLVRLNSWNPDEVSFEDYMSVLIMSMDCMLADETLQIHGITSLVDLEGVSRKALEILGDPKNSKQILRIWQDALPIRIKTQIFYNEPIIFDIVFQILSFFMNEKLKTRMIRVKTDMKKAITKIPGLEKILPKEYGGEGGTIEECAERWKQQIYNYFKNGNPLEGIEVDESKRPKETKEYLREYSDYKGVTLGTQGTYTKYDDLY